MNFNEHLSTKLTESEKSDLVLLFESQHWKTYRKVLITLKEGLTLSMLQESDPNKLLKRSGEVAGLNLSINQLGLMIAEIKRLERRVEGGSTNPTMPA